LKFFDLYNWDTTANMLFLHLLDNALSGVRSIDDAPASQSPVTDITDDFVNTRYHNGTDANGAAATWPVPVGTADTFLTSRSFAGPNAGPNVPPGPAGAVPGWTSSYNSGPGHNYTYTFTAAQNAILTQYLNNGGNVAIGLDPDCHFFNDQITFAFTSAPLQIPEPVTLALLGTGLVLVAHRRRRGSNAGANPLTS
jgi:hypothetical protein